MATACVQKAAYGLWGWASLWTEGTWNDLVNSPVEPMLAGRFHAPWLRRSCKKRRTGCGAGPACERRGLGTTWLTPQLSRCWRVGSMHHGYGVRAKSGVRAVGAGPACWWKLAGEFYGLKCSLFGMHDCLINTYWEGRQRQGFEKQQLAVEQM